MNYIKFAIVTAILGCSIQSLAAPDKVIYELREKCGKQAEEDFNRQYGTGIRSFDDGTFRTSGFRNHYNIRLNSCFSLISTDMPYKDKSGELQPRILYSLYDLNDNNEVATFDSFHLPGRPMNCQAQGKTCNSEAEFKALIKSFMED